MRRSIPWLGVIAVVALLSACAGARSAKQVLGPDPALQPRLLAVPAQRTMILRLPQPAHIGVLEITATGAEVLFPVSEAQQTLLARGQHNLPALSLWSHATTPSQPHGTRTRYCPNAGELTWYGTPDAPTFPRPATDVRVVNRRGLLVTCYRLPSYSPGRADTRHLLVIASRTPFTGDHIARAVQEFEREILEVPAGERAADLAQVLVSMAELREWSASYLPLRLDRY